MHASRRLVAEERVVEQSETGCGAKQKKKPQSHLASGFMEVTPGFEPGDEGFADPCLTTWLCHHIEKGAITAPFLLERATRLELATSTLARWRSTG